MTLPLNPGTWRADGAHSSVEFVVKHLGLSKVRGRFTKFAATVDVGDSVETSGVHAEVELSSVFTNDADRDTHLKSSEFFDVATGPMMTFHSTGMSGAGDHYTVHGDLTIRAITKPVELQVEFNGTATNPFTQALTAGFSAKGDIKRSDFGIDFNVPLGGDKFLVSDNVSIKLEVELIPVVTTPATNAPSTNAPSNNAPTTDDMEKS
jgi:polyisoprenoid-binding protein YceI